MEIKKQFITAINFINRNEYIWKDFLKFSSKLWYGNVGGGINM